MLSDNDGDFDDGRLGESEEIRQRQESRYRGAKVLSNKEKMGLDWRALLRKYVRPKKGKNSKTEIRRRCEPT